MLGVASGGDLKAPRYRVNFVFPTKEYERTRTEVLIETFIRKQLHLKAHTVTKVEETDDCMLVYIVSFRQECVGMGEVSSASSVTV